MGQINLSQPLQEQTKAQKLLRSWEARKKEREQREVQQECWAIVDSAGLESQQQEEGVLVVAAVAVETRKVDRIELVSQLAAVA